MNSNDATWLEGVLQDTALDSMVQMGRLAAAIYWGALTDGLSPLQARYVTEATIAAILQLGPSTMPPDGE